MPHFDIVKKADPSESFRVKEEGVPKPIKTSNADKWHNEIVGADLLKVTKKAKK